MNRNIDDRLAAGKTRSSRISREKRGADLSCSRAVGAAVKVLEELYLTDPDISLARISRAVLGEACRLTGSRFGFAGYTDPPTGWLMAATLAGKAPHKRRIKRGPFSSPEFNRLWGRVMKGKKPLVMNFVPSGRRAGDKPRGRAKIAKFLGVPAMSGRKQLGILALADPRGNYSAAELAAAGQLARVYALIIKRKLAEDLRRSEHDGLLALIASSQDIIYSADMEGKIVYASPKVAAYGYRPKEIIGRSIFELVHPQDREFVVKALAKARKTGRTLPMISYRLRKKNGGYFSMEQKSGIILSGGSPALITGVVRDVGEKLGAEKLLRENEATLRNIFETSKDAIFIKDLSGRYIKVNKACAEVLVLKPETALGRTDAEIFPPETARESVKDDREVVRGGKTIVRTYDRILPSGKYYFNTVKTPLRAAGGKITGILGVTRDITDVKKAESELAGFRAAEAMSKVAQPLAHDFNNALSVINGHATLIDEDVNASSRVKTGIVQIMNAVKWAAELTSRFQYFARNPKPGAGTGNFSNTTEPAGHNS
ncbi:MAG: PAS domain S-box protein [Elusimicrobiales bacterium]|jgi:PAS domain S-box-containing protein